MTETESRPATWSCTSGAVASLLGVSVTSVQRYADAGLLPCRRLPGGSRRFRRVDVEALLRSMTAAVSA